MSESKTPSTKKKGSSLFSSYYPSFRIPLPLVSTTLDHNKDRNKKNGKPKNTRRDHTGTRRSARGTGHGDCKGAEIEVAGVDEVLGAETGLDLFVLCSACVAGICCFLRVWFGWFG